MWGISVVEHANIPIGQSILHEWDHLLWKSKTQEKKKRRAFTEAYRRVVTPINKVSMIKVR